MIKLTKGIKKKELEADKNIREMQKNWNRLEVAINSLTQEISQEGLRTQVTRLPQQDVFQPRVMSTWDHSRGVAQP